MTGVALNGHGDVDWFKFSGSDTFGCTVDPSLTLTINFTSQVCVYAKCLSGSTVNGNQVVCPVGSTDDVSSQGFAGCCSTQSSGSLNITLDCDGSDDSADIHVKFGNLDSNVACGPYSFDYHF